MKRFAFAVVVACSVIASFISMAFADATSRITVGVKGMVCSFCAQGIKKTISRRAGVDHVDVDLDKKLVTVYMKEGSEFPDGDIRETILDAGYEVVSIERAHLDTLPESK